MTKFAGLFLAGASLFAAAPQNFTGIITDTMCAKDHKHMGVAPDAKCVVDCVKGGSKYALLVGDNVYTLSDQQTPAKFAAQKVNVTGTLSEKTKIIKVDSIQAAK